MATNIADAHLDLAPHHETSRASVDAGLWLPAIAGAMAYPILIHALFLVAQASKADTGGIQFFPLISQIVLIGLVLAVPYLALRGLLRIYALTAPNAPQIRRILHLAFATPPLYLLTSVAAGLLGLASPQILWWGGWIVLAIAVGATGATPAATLPQDRARSVKTPFRLRLPTRLRAIHRVAAVTLLLGFLILHLGNHLVALWTVPAQRAAMESLRHWYRATWIEPILLALFAAIVVSGLSLMVRLTRRPSDRFRVLQTASGAYLAVFIANHSLAVLSRRAAGLDPDWAFATGGAAGMLGSEAYSAVFPYYVLAVFLVGVHAALGARMVLLSKGVRRSRANRAAYWITGFAGGLTALTIAAILGVRLGA